MMANIHESIFYVGRIFLNIEKNVKIVFYFDSVNYFIIFQMKKSLHCNLTVDQKCKKE